MPAIPLLGHLPEEYNINSNTNSKGYPNFYVNCSTISKSQVMETTEVAKGND